MKKYLISIFAVVLALLFISCVPNEKPELNEHIVFVLSQNSNSEIYTMDVNGQNLRRLTDNPAIDDNPKWSPDGKKIAFASNRDGNREIYIMNADGSNQMRLTNKPGSRDTFPDWSPDGKSIAFSSDQHLFLLDLATGNTTPITSDDEVWDEQPSWSPDGLRLVFMSTKNSKSDIFVVNRDGGGRTALTNSNWNTEKIGQPIWLSDGRIAFGKITFDNRSETGTFSMLLDGRDVKQITDKCVGGSWSADGQWVVCELRLNGNNNSSELYILRIADGKLFRLTDTPYSELDPDLYP